MNRKEFIDKLREQLIGEIPVCDIESNIEYYDRYIKEHSNNKQEEYQCIEEIGDPVLVARTIITSYQFSENSNDKEYEESYTEQEKEDVNGSILKMIPMKYRIVGIVCTIVLLIILFYIAKFFFFILIRVLLPIAAIAIVMGIIMRWIKR